MLSAMGRVLESWGGAHGRFTSGWNTPMLDVIDILEHVESNSYGGGVTPIASPTPGGLAAYQVRASSCDV
jgi:hypothetical protein